MLLDFSLLDTILLDGDDDIDTVLPHSGAPGGRFVSDDELALLLTGNYAVFPRVKIADAAGVMKNYQNRNGYDWTQSVEWEETVDAPIATATVRLAREWKRFSLAPLRTDSLYNVTPFIRFDPDTGAAQIVYGPALDAGRRITIEVATVALGTAVEDVPDARWHLVFDGYVESVDVDANPIVLECRNLGAQFQDVWFPAPGIVEPDGGDPTMTLQAGIQKLIDALAVQVSLPLWVPVAPDPEVDITAFTYAIEPGMDAMLRLASINGWDLRAKFSDDDQAMRWAFVNPGRDRTTFDFTIGPRNYIDVKQMRVDRANVRNEIWIWYGPDDDRHVVFASDGSSQSLYFKRMMVLQEPSDSPIQDEASAQLMADLILFDLDAPLTQKAVEMPFFWPVEIHNRIRFKANHVHSDIDLDLAVVSYRHRIDNTTARTTIGARGAPSLGYWRWQSRRPIPPSGAPAEPTDPLTPTGFAAMVITPDFAADSVRLDWNWGGDPLAEFEVFLQNGGTDYISQGSTGTTTHFTIFSSFDIEPFRSPPEEPQRSITFSFYVVATVSGSTVATSPKITQSYGNGP